MKGSKYTRTVELVTVPFARFSQAMTGRRKKQEESQLWQ
jgi:hypothetical protein